MELTTLGSDAGMGRRAVLDIELAHERVARRRLVFVGNGRLFRRHSRRSGIAGEDRFLTSNRVLLIHCRQL